MMYSLYDSDSGEKIGEITAEQLRFLIDQLEEESLADKDYYINRATLDFFETMRPDPGFITLLREALGDRDDMEVRWSTE